MKMKFLTIGAIIFSKGLLGQTFIDVAASHNIYESYSSTPDFGGGVSFFDFDNDGWDDLTFVSPDDSLKVYKNNNGYYAPFYTGINIIGQVKQALWVDFNNDEFNDLCISIENGPCMLYKNNGNNSFTDITFASGMPYLPGANYSVAFGDYNKDGFLDLLIGRYSYSTDSTNLLQKNALYKNNGNLTFTDVTSISGIDIGLTQTFEAVWLDYNKDGWPDIYTATDRYDYDNALFKNNGDGTFTDVAMACGAAAVNVNAMTNTVGDFDNDADLDIYLTNIGYSDTCKLLVNHNNNTFTEEAVQWGLGNTQFTWGASWLDADNDGFLDLMIACDSGNTDPRTYLYMNNGGSGFVDSPQNFQSNSIGNSRSIANGDFNNDGQVDVVIGNTTNDNSFLWQNTSMINNFIKISLKGSLSNRMAIGSWIYVHAGGTRYSHYTMCGENFLGQNSQHHLFGLAQHQIVDSVVIEFLSGTIDKYYNLAANQAYTFIESGSAINHISHNGNLAFCTGDSTILDAGIYDSYLWSNGDTTRFLTALQSGNYSVVVTDSIGLIFNSDSINVFVAAQPQINVNATGASCYNVYDGSIDLDVINETSSYTINWNQGLQGKDLIFLMPGNYIYSYTDTFGCALMDSIYIDAPFPINLQLLVTDYSALSYGEIQCIINGGTAPYTISLNGTQVGNNVDSLLPGNYLLSITDNNGCLYTQNFIVDDLTVTAIYNEIIEVSLSPNPIDNNMINIHSNVGIDAIMVYDLFGNKIDFILNNNTLLVDELYQGLLFVCIEVGGKHFRYKILKIN
jgi:hypothetical protein